MAEPEDSKPTEAPEQETDGVAGPDREEATEDAYFGSEQTGSTETSQGSAERPEPPPGRETVTLSHSVDAAVRRFPGTEPISAVALVDAILDQANHREGYAGGRASGISLVGSDGAEKRPVGEWLAAVRELFDPDRAEELHGRLVVVGLAMLDARLREQLQQNGFLPGVKEEISEPIDDLLTPLGWRLRTTPDSVPNQPDDPLETIENDQLGRAAFADYLARRLDAVPGSSSYAVHLDGPWGAGKSTVLNFLDAKLRRRPERSRSLHGVLDRFSETERVRAVTLVEAILDEGDPPNREVYAGGRAADLSVADANDGEGGPAGTWFGDVRARVDPSRRGRQTVRAWLSDVRALFDDGRVLTGRHVVVGLGWLDPQVRERLRRDDVLSTLESELSQPPLVDRLTEEGRALYESVRDGGTDVSPDGSRRAERESEGATTSTGPTPAVPRQSPDAPDRSEPPNDPWLVVRFNAWQHQHVRPPWWPLMDQVFHESKPELRRRDRAREYWWRFSAGRLPLIVGITALTLLVAVALPTVLQAVPSDTPVLSYLAANADAISAVLALVGVVWAGIQVVNEPSFLRSAAAAQSYVEFTSNPMNEIKDRFNTLVDRVPVRVAVFVDDLDRCESAYVVELLEGIQTLFKDAPVVYVVAADRRWVTTCFEQEYDSHTSSVQEPGKPLGTLFLEKLFQVSTPLPGISDEVKRKYWQELIQVQSDDESDASDEELSAVLERVSEMQTEGEIRRVLEESGDRSFREERAIREEAVKRIASADIEKRSEHLLKPFASLLDPNPRAMKRLVNAYNIHLALMMIAELDIDRDHLALWTILMLNWPQLAQYLGENPEMVGQLKQGDVTGVSSEMEALFTDPDVLDVVTGEPLTAELTPSVVEDCATIRA